jgi:3-hydroxyisobutyrate dehydrogenase-like beta-hydroxyacid dehydrogenase
MAELTVGFVGVGDQGAPMARNIAGNGYKLIVYDIRESSLVPFRQLGIPIAASLGQIAARCEAVAVCVLNDQQVRSVTFDADGLLAAMKPGQLLVLHSTVAPKLAIEIGDKAAAKGIDFVDAPVSGSKIARELGKLTVFCGAAEQAFERARPLLDAVGEGIRLLGPAGMGQVCKVCNNLMLYCNTLAAFEAARLAEAYGLAETTMVAMAARSTGGSYVLQEWGSMDRLLEEHPLASDESALLAFLEKDLHLASEAGQERGVELSMTERAITTMSVSLRKRRSLVRQRNAGSASKRD